MVEIYGGLNLGSEIFLPEGGGEMRFEFALEQGFGARGLSDMGPGDGDIDRAARQRFIGFRQAGEKGVCGCGEAEFRFDAWDFD